MHQYTLETDRLVLRPLTVADAPAVFVWGGDPEVNRYMSYPLERSEADAEAWLRTVEESEGDLEFGFVRKADGLLIGSGGAYPREDGSWVVGYNFRRDCWGRGYATEALRAIIDFVHGEKGGKVFTADHAVANPASGRVMEKCGMEFVGYGEYSKLDGSVTFPAKCYRLELE